MVVRGIDLGVMFWGLFDAAKDLTASLLRGLTTLAPLAAAAATVYLARAALVQSRQNALQLEEAAKMRRGAVAPWIVPDISASKVDELMHQDEDGVFRDGYGCFLKADAEIDWPRDRTSNIGSWVDVILINRGCGSAYDVRLTHFNTIALSTLSPLPAIPPGQKELVRLRVIHGREPLPNPTRLVIRYQNIYQEPFEQEVLLHLEQDPFITVVRVESNAPRLIERP